MQNTTQSSSSQIQRGESRDSQVSTRLVHPIETIGSIATRFGLVIVIGWVGAMKFTAYEAEGISGLVQNSPLMSWVYEMMSVRAFAATLGSAELVIAVMIGLGLWFHRLGALGAMLACGMFATTLSFMFTTPGVFEPTLGGFPALSIAPGQFLVKDLALLGASLWLLGNSLTTLRHRTDSQ